MHMHMPHVHARAHGSRCVGEVKSVGQIAADAAVAQIDNLTGGSSSSDPMAGARMSQAAASKAASKPPVITKSSAPAKPLTMDELIANSIAQKAGVLGRHLSTLKRLRAVMRLLRLLRARRAALGSWATGRPTTPRASHLQRRLFHGLLTHPGRSTTRSRRRWQSR